MIRRCLTIALTLLLPCLAAAQQAPGPYVSLGAGVDVLQDQVVKPANGFGPTQRDFTFDPSPAVDLALGYSLGNGLRLELEGDYARNHLSGVKFPSGQAGEAVGNEAQFGGFVNLAYDFRLGLPVMPFVGIGAGYQALQLDHVGAGAAGAVLNPQLSPTEGTFAYQGMAGLSYRVVGVPGLSLTAEYRLIGVVTPSAFQRILHDQDDPSLDRTGYATLSNTFNHEALIGLRYNFGAPPLPVPPPATPQAPPPPAAPATRTYLVFFDWDRADLSDRARQIVAEAAAASTHVATTRIDVNGYTDLSGGADYNQRLSVRRAEAVEAELVRDGVPKAEIIIRGLGETNPLVPTAPGVREPQNRRVEIVLQ